MSLTLEKILCAVDFSPFSGRVMEYGKALARSFGARLFLFHAVHFPSDRLYASDVLERGPKEQALSIRALEEMERAMAGASVDWEPVIACGEPAEVICRTVDQRRIDLVVGASHGLSGVKRLLLGTVVERLARRLARPLLVVRPPPSRRGARSPDPEATKTVLAGCRFLTGDNPVIGYAAGLAGPLGARLHVLHAIEAPLDETLVDPTQGPYGEVQAQLSRKRHRLLDQVVEGLGNGALNVVTSVVEGVPCESLCAHAARIDADLIVVGVRQRKRIENILAHSTTESILRTAPCPVLTVPYPESVR